MQDRFGSQPLLEIFLLGKFQVRVDGVTIDEKLWVRRSAQSLVKLLAIKPLHMLHREQIMDLIFAEQTPETVSKNLNKAVHSARRTLEPNLAKGAESRFILTRKKQILLDSPGILWIDLDEFEKLANYALKNNDLEAGQKAVEMYRGDLLVEDLYEDWIFTRRESMRALFRKTATETAEIFAANLDYAKSIEILKKLITDDSSDEYVQRLLMRFYAAAGDKYEALKQFEHCRAALRDLGIEPEPETVELEQSIKCGEITPTKKQVVKSASIVSTPQIKQLTFQNGVIKSARFTPDGERIIFNADWNGSLYELFQMRIDSGEMQSERINNAHIYSVAADGQLAIGFNPKQHGFISPAVLTKFNLAERKTYSILNDVHWAEWHPANNSNTPNTDEKFLAVVRARGGKTSLEFPVGNVICETDGWLGRPRFSIDGMKIAIIEHPFWGDDRGFVICLDLKNKQKLEKQVLTAVHLSMQGLAWVGNEIWFTGSQQGNGRIIYAVTLDGAERSIYQGTGRLTLHDASKNGKVLVADEKMRVQVAVRLESEKIERDLSWHDWTLPRDLTDDGKTLLFEEAGLSGGTRLAAYVRDTDGTSTRKLADGSAIQLSPDGKHALLRFHHPHSYLGVMPIEGGKIKPLKIDSGNPLNFEVTASYFPDGRRIMFAAIDADGKTNIYIQEIDGGLPVLFKAENERVKMRSAHTISPNGEYAVLTNPENRLALYRTSDGTGSPLKKLKDEFYLVRWAGDGEHIFIWQRGEIPAVVYKYNLSTGKKVKWLKLMPRDALGVYQITGIKLTPDGKNYAYSYSRENSDLYLMENLQ